MIDRPARDTLANLLVRLIDGEISNDDFEEGTPSSNDSAVEAVSAAAWGLYSDYGTEYLKGRRSPSPELRTDVNRWVLFVNSDFEYEWPPYELRRIYNWPMNLITFGAWERRKEKRFAEFRRAGDFDVWPFIQRGQVPPSSLDSSPT